ncbi:hypothetical protein D9619_005032 [Psilocybe cf. subviscida]|uniref:Uncharacterized protein n=1 Tax=Psilocybe cf. subviscida TaxID=2480587 RepID=A0A8H5BQR6_9AGAR|nr:hypothetical protein D9619_005032 [Psilocybe cf. subviscida]
MTYGHVASTGVPLAAFGYWLSLSDNLPLHLFVDTPRNYKTGRRRVDHHTAMHSQKLMAVLAEDRHLTRWKSISVVLTSALCTQLTETLIHRYYTLHSPIGLERIEIEVPNQSLPVTQLLQAIGLVPALRVLFWRSIFSSQFQTFIELPLLGQLTRILLHMPMSVCEATMFLAKCNTAAHVTLKGIYMQSEAVPPFIETLSKLTELNLSGIQNVMAVLDNLLCPGLKILDIDNRTSRPHPQSWESLDAFFTRSQAKPNRVVIRHTSELSSDDLAGYLRIGQQSGIPYYMITSRHAHVTASTVLEHKYGLGPFTRYVRTPGGGEYVGMDRRARGDWNSDKISLRDVSTRSSRNEMVFCAAFKVAINNVHSVSTTASLATLATKTGSSLRPRSVDRARTRNKGLAATGLNFLKGGIPVFLQREELVMAVKNVRKAIFTARTWRILAGRLLETLAKWSYTFAFSLGFMADPEVILALDQLRRMLNLNRTRWDGEDDALAQLFRMQGASVVELVQGKVAFLSIPLVLHSHHGYGKYLVSGGCLIIVEDYDIGLIMLFDMIETVFEGHLVHCVYPGEVDKYDDAAFHFAFTRHRRTCIRLETTTSGMSSMPPPPTVWTNRGGKPIQRLTTSWIFTSNE